MADDFLSIMKVLPDPNAVMQGQQDAANLQQTNLQNQTGQFNLQQAQQQAVGQQAAQQAYHQDVASFIQNPTAEGASSLLLKHPDQQKAISDAWSMRDDAQKQSDLNQLGQVYSLLQSNRPDLAQSQLEARLAADQQAGHSEPMVQTLLDAIKSDPKTAQGIAAYSLATSPLGKDFATTLKAVQDGSGNSTHVINEGGALVDDSGKVLYQAGKGAKYEKVKNADGTESIVEIPQGMPGGGAANAPAGTRTTGGWTPRATNGGDNPDNVVDNKIKGAASFLGVDPHADISGMSPMQIAKAMTLSEGGAGTLADRNNNPANLRNADGSYKQFPSKDAGLTAAAALVARKLKNGQTTVASMIEGLPVGGRPAQTNGARVVATSQGGGDPSSGPGGLDQSAITYYAQQVLAGAPMPAIGMGKQAAAARTAIMGEVAKQAGASGLNGADLAQQISHYKAGSAQIKNLEVMAGNVSQSEQTALANGQQFIDRSSQIPGQTSYPFINGIMQSAARATGNADLAAHDAALNTFVNEYAKVVAGSPNGSGVLSDSARREAQETMRGNYSLAQKQAAFSQMKADMANRIAAIHSGLNDAYTHLTSKPGYAVPSDTSGLGGVGRQAQHGGQSQQRLSPQQAAALPPGTHFIGLDGQPRVRH